ncbi:BnaC01g32340D [Brassica napus]|uniref:BnaC01g32340D protein n=1 Tax=Brassica napus TaxID=3708 RepID=A0A078GQF7_BRANA|nr:BnaC01g32340D [Brassica napus]
MLGEHDVRISYWKAWRCELPSLPYSSCYS